MSRRVPRPDAEPAPSIQTEAELARLAVALGAEQVSGWSAAETALVAAASEGQPAARAAVPNAELSVLRERIRAGEDPLGAAFCALRPGERRRPLGQTYTPAGVVSSMVEWAGDRLDPALVIDPGAGSARYLMAAAARFPRARLLGVDVDPLATLMARANLAVLGHADRAEIQLSDYRDLPPGDPGGRTLYLGNPPYVRHHQIEPRWKAWLLETARRRALSASGLAGLHVHFFLATAEHGRPGDVGAFITSAEWLDVNYGSLVRELLLDGLGGQSLHILEPEAAVFTDAITTGAITCFELGSRPSSVKLRRVKDVTALGRLEGGRPVARARLIEAGRWSVFTRTAPKPRDGYVELGELVRVHRGAVTGANSAWITRLADSPVPAQVLTPAVTRARELFAAGDRLADPAPLRRVIDLPVDLDVLEPDVRKAVERYLKLLKKRRVHEGYIAANRRAWWSVGLRAPAPVLATYMARRPPAFVHNDADARHVNIAHGLYPRQALGTVALERLVSHLRTAVTQAQGRTYAGGLTKFEPKEMERLIIPGPELLGAGE